MLFKQVCSSAACGLRSTPVSPSLSPLLHLGAHKNPSLHGRGGTEGQLLAAGHARGSHIAHEHPNGCSPAPSPLEFLPRAPSPASPPLSQPLSSCFPRAAEPLEGKRLRETARARLPPVPLQPRIPAGRSPCSAPQGVARPQDPRSCQRTRSEQPRTQGAVTPVQQEAQPEPSWDLGRFEAFWRMLTHPWVVCLKFWV